METACLQEQSGAPLKHMSVLSRGHQNGPIGFLASLGLFCSTTTMELFVFNPLRNPTNCRHKMLASPPWLWSKMQASPPWPQSIWWRARRDLSQFGGEPAMTTVILVASLPRPRSNWWPKSHLSTSPSNKRMASPPWTWSKTQASLPNRWDRRLLLTAQRREL